MKYLNNILLLILFLTFSVFGGDSMSHDPIQIGELLSKSLPLGWSCFYNDTMLIITYDKKVDLLNDINLPAEPAAELLNDYGFKMFFFYSFHFVNKYTQEEYDSLNKMRNDAINKIESNYVKSNIKGKDINSLILNIKKKYIIPEYYNDEYSVFFYKAINDNYIVFPNKVEKEAEDILLKVEKYIKKYPPGNNQGEIVPRLPQPHSDDNK